MARINSRCATHFFHLFSVLYLLRCAFISAPLLRNPHLSGTFSAAMLVIAKIFRARVSAEIPTSGARKSRMGQRLTRRGSPSSKI